MNRRSTEEWLAEQSKDHGDFAPVTLELVESHTRLNTAKQMMLNEAGIGDYRKVNDVDVCAEIDRVLTRELQKPSVYTWTHDEKTDAARYLKSKFYIGESQLYRCLAMGYFK
jgi:hypothetical protein